MNNCDNCEIELLSQEKLNPQVEIYDGFLCYDCRRKCDG